MSRYCEVYCDEYYYGLKLGDDEKRQRMDLNESINYIYESTYGPYTVKSVGFGGWFCISINGKEILEISYEVFSFGWNDWYNKRNPTPYHLRIIKSKIILKFKTINGVIDELFKIMSAFDKNVMSIPYFKQDMKLLLQNLKRKYDITQYVKDKYEIIDEKPDFSEFTAF